MTRLCVLLLSLALGCEDDSMAAADAADGAGTGTDSGLRDAGLDAAVDGVTGSRSDGATPGADVGQSMDCDGPASVTVGTGVKSYEPIVDGARLPLVFGPQGGWHIWTGFVTRNTRNRVTIKIRYYLTESGITVSDYDEQLRFALVPDDDDPCLQSYFGITAFAADPDDVGLADGGCDTPPEVLGHRELCMQLEIIDEDGAAVSDTKCFIAVPSVDDATPIDETCFPP